MGKRATGTKASRSRKAKRGANGKGKGNVVLRPKMKKTVRVPINAKEYAAKEHESAKVDIAIAKLERKIAPDKNEIRKLRKTKAKLTADLEENSEDREMLVREEWHINTNEIRVLDLKGNELSRRTMTKEERKFQTDIEDETPETRDADEEPAATPMEAMEAARAEDADEAEGSA